MESSAAPAKEMNKWRPPLSQPPFSIVTPQL
jgi:hypothetical protein